ncbi:hypothetical protein HYV83_01330 [Candidatus Woesearchaeota archaeon]|nr:hypothetical protein [Candidatus Woesearchaeota archaeon]
MKLNIGKWFSRSGRAKAADSGQGLAYDQSLAMSKIEFAIRTWFVTQYLEFIGSKDASSANITVSGGHNSGEYVPYASRPQINTGVLSLPVMWGRGPESYLIAQTVIDENTDRPFSGNLERLIDGGADMASYVANNSNKFLEATKIVLQIRPLSSDREAELFSQGIVYRLRGVYSNELVPKVSGEELEAFELGAAVGSAANPDFGGHLNGTTWAVMQACEASGKDPRMFGRKVLEEILSDKAFSDGIDYYNREGKVQNPAGHQVLVSFKEGTYPLHLTGLDFSREYYGFIYKALDKVLGLQMGNLRSKAGSPK